jgi:hypothetical protein
MSDRRQSGTAPRGRTPLTVGIVVVLLLGSMAALTVGWASPARVGSNAPIGPPSGVRTSTRSLDAALGNWSALALPDRERAYVSLMASSPSDVQTALAAHGYYVDGKAALNWLFEHPNVVLHPSDSGSFINSLIGAGIGCAVGGFVGSFVPVVGTAAGCAVGAIVTLLGIAYFTSSAGGLGILHEDGIVRGQDQIFANAQNATKAFLTNTLSLFNATLYAWESAADAVAVNQLANSSFNYTMDIAQSGIGAVFDSLVGPYILQTSLDLQNLNRIMAQLYDVPGLTNVHDYIVGGSGWCLGVCAMTLNWYGGIAAYQETTSGSPQFIEVLPFEPVSGVCSSGTGVVISSLTNKTVLSLTTTTKFVKNWTDTSGGYLFIGSAGTNCNLDGSGVIGLAASPTSGAASAAIIVSTCGAKAVEGSCNPLNHTHATSGQTPETIQAFNSSGPAALTPSYTFLAGVYYAYNHQFNAMIQSSESNAFTYWFYLRTLGYHSLSSIPSGCLIPPPSLAVPPTNLANVAYTINYTEAAYAGELNALGTFYNVAPNTTSFCHGHPKFVLGGASSPPFGENISGFILTLPVGTHQKWKSPHTWAVNGSNVAATGDFAQVGATNATAIGLVIWPSVITYGYSIPLNTVVMIPQNDPMLVDVLQTLTFLTLNGNGSFVTHTTASQNVLTGTPAASSAGAEIYLTSCVINSIAENPCVINGTSYSNVTGTQTGGGSGPLFFATGSCGLGVPFFDSIATGIANAVSAVPFIGGVACGVGIVVEFIVLALVVVFVVYLVLAVVRRD